MQENVPHLSKGWTQFDGTIFDGELVCPLAVIDTGSSITAAALQATVAIISTSPENARQVQERQNAHLRLHVFDILRHRGTDVTGLPLLERTDLVHRAVAMADNPFLEIVQSDVINKRAVHDQIIAAGGEGSVWKKSDEPYQPGRRIKHGVKRKRGVEVEAFVTGFKPGTAERGHAHLVGALGFSVRQDDGTSRPIAWVCGLTDAERHAMTQHDLAGDVRLNPAFLGRRAMVTGQDSSAKSRRIQHASVLYTTNHSRRLASDQANRTLPDQKKGVAVILPEENNRTALRQSLHYARQEEDSNVPPKARRTAADNKRQVRYNLVTSGRPGPNRRGVL